MTYEEAIAYENRLHQRFIAPFDRLLERKAEYYIKQTEATGKKYEMLLEEIETLDRLREYILTLENIMQEQTTKMHHMGLAVEHWKAQYLAEIQYNTMQNELVSLAINQAEKWKPQSKR